MDIGQPATTGTVYLTLTQIFSGGKAKVNLHATPKLTVDMPINCLLRPIQFPRPQNDAITSCTCAGFPCFQSSPAIKSFLELTDCCLVYPTFFAIRFAFFHHSIKIANFFVLGVISFPFHAILTGDVFRHQCRRMTSYPMT